MFAAVFSFSLVPIAIVIGFGLPWLWLRWELKYQARLHEAELSTQASVIEDQEATIHAYREVVNFTMDNLQLSAKRAS